MLRFSSETRQDDQWSVMKCPSSLGGTQMVAAKHLGLSLNGGALHFAIDVCKAVSQRHVDLDGWQNHWMSHPNIVVRQWMGWKGPDQSNSYNRVCLLKGARFVPASLWLPWTPAPNVLRWASATFCRERPYKGSSVPATCETCSAMTFCKTERCCDLEK